jgi:hypothetical protein
MKRRKWRKRLRGLCAAIALLLILPAICKAELITLAVTGEVSFVDDYINVFGGSIGSGDLITGTYTYDPATQDSEPSDPAVGLYHHNTAPAGISLTIGGFTFTTDPSSVNFDIRIEDNYLLGEDRYWLQSHSNLDLTGGVGVGFISWQLADHTGTPLSDDSLPLREPDLSGWDTTFPGGNWIYIEGSETRTFAIGGSVTSVLIVPEPITILLLTGGFLLARHLYR